MNFFLPFFIESYLMADDQPFVAADQANISTSASTILADLIAIFFALFLRLRSHARRSANCCS